MLMGRFSGHQAFLLERDPVNRAAHRFWIDVLALLHEPKTKLRISLEEAIAMYIPLAASHLISLKDDASEEVAKLIESEISEARAKCLVVTQDVDEWPADAVSGAIIAVGCIGSGNSLQSISRELRGPLEASPRIYLALLAKYSDSDRYRSFVSDLTFNGVSFKHEVVVLNEMSLPHPSFLTAWTKEEELFRRLISNQSSVVSCVADVVRWIEARLAQLRQPRIGGRLDLFLPSPTNTPLKLRPGFAFWRHEYDPDHISQGDVFATVAAVLQGLRARSDARHSLPKLSHSAFHSAVLAPGCFGRFNDGVIQASFLRAALPHELNYAGRPDLSAEMTRIIERTIERWQASQGEACGEFLLALATKRMTLTLSDLGRIRALPAAQRLPPELLHLFNAIK